MRPRGRHAAALGLAVVIGGVLAGCGSSSTGSSRPATGATPTTAPAADRVAMGEYFFRPAAITVRVGQPVTFVNEGRIQHTVADTAPSGAIRSRLIRPRPLDPGQSQVVVFHTPGTVTYLCTFHPSLMSGRIIVTR